MLRDERRLGRRLEGVRKVRDPESRAKVLANITAEVDAAEARIAARTDSRPEITYPSSCRSARCVTTSATRSGTTRW